MSMVNEIYNFIKTSFTEEFYNDCKEYSGIEKAFGGNYRVFLSHNKICLDELDKDELTFAYVLYKKIINKKIITLKSTSSGYGSEMPFTFYFNINGEIIIY